MLMKSFSVFFLLGAVCFSSTYALSCYECQYPGNIDCRIKGSNVIKKCPELNATETLANDTTVCTKTLYKEKYKQKHYVNRGCSTKSDSNSTCQKFNVDHNGVNDHCSYCETDLCNGSPIWITVWSVATLVIFTLFVHYVC